MLYNSIIKIKDYKYYLLPSFIDFKKCLQNVKKEKFIKIFLYEQKSFNPLSR